MKSKETQKSMAIVGVRVPRDVKAAAMKQARAGGLRLSDVVRRLLAAYVAAGSEEQDGGEEDSGQAENGEQQPGGGGPADNQNSGGVR